MKFRIGSAVAMFVAAVAWTCGSGIARGQVQNIGVPSINQVTYNTTIGAEVHNETATNNSAAGTVKLGLKGDWYVPIPVGAATIAPELIAILPFSVGNLPVEIDGITLDLNAKWVNGGGNATDPVTKWTVTATLYDQTGALPTGTPGPAGYSDPKVVTFPINDTLTGNGLRTINQGNSLFTPFILSSGHNYYLTIDDYASITVGAGYTNSTPTIVVTHEFGGTFGDSFNGFSASFSWESVPEPTSLMLMAGGGIGLFATRRIVRRGANG